MITLDCPACGTQLQIVSDNIVYNERHMAQHETAPASAQFHYALPLHQTAIRTNTYQNVSFWESMRAILMLFFLLACLFTIAVAVIMDFEAITVLDAKADSTTTFFVEGRYKGI